MLYRSVTMFFIFVFPMHSVKEIEVTNRFVVLGISHHGLVFSPQQSSFQDTLDLLFLCSRYLLMILKELLMKELPKLLLVWLFWSDRKSSIEKVNNLFGNLQTQYRNKPLIMLFCWATKIVDEPPKTDLQFWKNLFPVSDSLLFVFSG